MHLKPLWSLDQLSSPKPKILYENFRIKLMYTQGFFFFGGGGGLKNFAPLNNFDI